MTVPGDYDVRIARRPSGAPKLQVEVWPDGKLVGEDYAGSLAQARQLADRMVQRHRKRLIEPLRKYGDPFRSWLFDSVTPGWSTLL